MLKRNGYLVVHRTCFRVPLATILIVESTYTLEGGPVIELPFGFGDEDDITWQEIEQGFLVRGAFRFRVVESDGFKYLCALETTPFLKLRMWLHRARHGVRRFGYRLLATAQVWGLAQPAEFGAFPSWRDVKILWWLFGGKREQAE